MDPVSIGNSLFDENAPPILIAGPCVIESEAETLRLADLITSLPITKRYTFVFKASYLKDNRSASASFRGPGIHDGLEILNKVREKIGCPVLSDVHSPQEVPAAAKVLDILQVPAFLSRQTSLLEAAAAGGKTVNIKKGQFLSPEQAGLAVEKVRSAGCRDILLTERGTSFGYNDLVVDFRSFSKMKVFGCPIIFDVTHSLQKPGGLGDRSGGEPELAESMARAGAAVLCDGLFVETHVEPRRAKSDGASMVPFPLLERLLERTHRVFTLVREMRVEEEEVPG
jgi:2-dehydro-3-deoxyphosphooctonate aldolase (KDO 8-P synthase)